MNYAANALEKKPAKKKSGKKAKLDSDALDDNVKFVPGGLNEEIDSGNSSADSEEELEIRPKKDAEQEIEEDDVEETVQEKRLRLAKQYIAEIERQEKERAETLNIDRKAVSHRLKEDLLDQSGKLQRKIADKYIGANENEIIQLKGHSLSPICLIISPDDKFIYSGSKDCSLIKWCVESKKKVKIVAGGKKRIHRDHILSLAITSDNKFLASGSRDKFIRIWNPETMELIHTFRGHRDAVSVKCFLCFLNDVVVFYTLFRFIILEAVNFSYISRFLIDIYLSLNFTRRRVWLSAKDLISCTALRSTDPSSCGNWTRWPTWRHCSVTRT